MSTTEKLIKGDVIILIQARMGSSRLPGKSLMMIHGKTILQHVIERCSASIYDPIIAVATSTSPSDDILTTHCLELGVSVFRGSEDNVLQRMTNAWKKFGVNCKIIVRICADNPLIDARVVDKVIKSFDNSDCDYLSNANHPPGYHEDGFAVEVFSSEALVNANKHAFLNEDLEHVGPFIKRNFKSKFINTCPEYGLKLSVDTQADFDRVRHIFDVFREREIFSIWEVNEEFGQSKTEF